MRASPRLLAGVLVAVVAVSSLALFLVPKAVGGPLVPFGSYAELAAYLERSRSAPGGGDLFRGWEGGLLQGPGTTLDDGVPAYSGTNVQVEGVDELDIVKTDGIYVYVASGGNVTILRAYPPEAMAVVATVAPVIPSDTNATNVAVQGVFVEKTRLAIVAAGYEPGSYDGRETFAWSPGRSWAIVTVVDIERPWDPAILFTASVSGTPFAARMIHPFVYVIANDWIAQSDSGYEVPQTCGAESCEAFAPASIYYDPEATGASSFTNLLALNLSSGEFVARSAVTGWASTVYMSTSALYVTFTKWSAGTAVLPFVSSTSTTSTTIHKVLVSGLDMTPVARADLPGTLLNQFSLDEFGGFLRVATTSLEGGGDVLANVNNVYVLEASGMEIVGRLEGLAPGETIHAARFLGDRAYLVTFQKIDPFFVLDLSDPYGPRVLGYLKIPGFSDYLHPIDSDHVLGIGKEAIPAEEGDFSWFQGLKLSVFNVSDVENPVEEARTVIGDRGTDSEVLRDHKALLFDAERGLLVLPVLLAEIDPEKWPEPLPPSAYGDPVWQGAYVFHLSVSSGFELRGRITHLEESVADVFNASRHVERSLYIGDVLYTLSPTLLKANALDSLEELGTVEFENDLYGTYPIPRVA